MTFPANNNHDLSLQTAILMIPNADNDTPPKHNRLVPFLEEMSVFTLMSGSKFRIMMTKTRNTNGEGILTIIQSMPSTRQRSRSPSFSRPTKQRRATGWVRRQNQTQRPRVLALPPLCLSLVHHTVHQTATISAGSFSLSLSRSRASLNAIHDKTVINANMRIYQSPDTPSPSQSFRPLDL